MGHGFTPGGQESVLALGAAVHKLQVRKCYIESWPSMLNIKKVFPSKGKWLAMQVNVLCLLEVQGMVVCPHVETFATGTEFESSDQISFRVPIRGSKNNHQTVKINRSRTHCCNLTFDPLKIKPLHKGTINWSKTKIMAPVANASTGDNIVTAPWRV